MCAAAAKLFETSSFLWVNKFVNPNVKFPLFPYFKIYCIQLLEEKLGCRTIKSITQLPNGFKLCVFHTIKPKTSKLQKPYK